LPRWERGDKRDDIERKDGARVDETRGKEGMDQPGEGFWYGRIDHAVLLMGRR
jgi:hypothetical protein